MKKSEALTLQEGDLVDVRAPDWQGGLAFGCKVLLVSSKGGVFVIWTARGWSRWGGLGRWLQFHHVTAVGRREPLTENERAIQVSEVERFQAYRDWLRQDTRKSYLRNQTPLADAAWEAE